MRILLLFSLFSLSVPLVVHATVVEYTDRQAWEAAAGEFTNINFDGLISNTDARFTNSLSLKGVTFTGATGPVLAGYAGPTPNPDLMIVSAANASNAYVSAWEPGDKLTADLGGMNVLLPGDTKAFGMDIMPTATYFNPTFDSSFKFVLSDGQVFDNVFASRPPTVSFVGFISTDSISSVYLNSYSSFPMIDNFSFVSSVPLVATPEPATCLSSTMGLTIVLACLFVQRKHSWSHETPAPENLI